MMQGVFKAYKKNMTKYYRASITFMGKHISLGSFDSEEMGSAAYEEAKEVLYGTDTIANYNKEKALSFDKWVTLINYRDNKMYIKTPIYIRKRFFEYYLSPDCILKFDVDDLFYYSHHTIMTREGYMFVADYGMQINILSRYGIKNHAVEGRDYEFVNGDNLDYRYGNVKVINPYYGVTSYQEKGKIFYKVKIHVIGDYIVGTYPDEVEAAVAYNKAADIINKAGFYKEFPKNYIEELTAIEYAKIYNSVNISKKIRDFA